MDESISLQIEMEESMLLWKRGEHTVAKHLMKAVIKQFERVKILFFIPFHQ